MERLSRTKRSVIGVRAKRGRNVLAPKGKVVYTERSELDERSEQ